MPNASLRIAALLALACAAMPANAQSPAEDQGALRREWEQSFGRTKPVPAVPVALRRMVRTTSEWVVVAMQDGSERRIGIGALTIEEMEGFQDNRFVGFKIFGNEEFGYIVVDRKGRGELAEIATGTKPSFSEDGRHFAAAEISESGFGNLNGVALYEVLPNGVKRVFYTDTARGGFDWRTDGFVGPSCVRISAVEQGWEPTAPDRWDQEVGNAPRAWYELRWSAEDGLYFGRSSDAACYDDSSG